MLDRPMRTFAAAVPLLLSMLVPPAARAVSEEAVDLEEWIEGPIRYISLKEETKTFRTLSDDRARALFIERFWARRDPSPETLTNEYRQVFWERVREANDNFRETTKPGWLTDRGKIHILYGPPNDVEDYHDLNVDSLSHVSPTAGRGVIRWIYTSRPGGRMDVDPITVVPFVRDVSGEYRLSREPRLASVFFDAAAIHEGRYATYEKYLEDADLPRSELSVMLDLGRLQEVPPQAQVLIERVETSEAYETDPLECAVQRYSDPATGEAVVVITVRLPGTPDEREVPAILARLSPHDATRAPRLLGEDSFRIVSDGATRLGQGRLRVEPGPYVLTVVVADPQRIATGMFRDQVVVPDPTERMRFSDMTWAARLEPLQYASLASYDEPFVVGAFRVVPRVGGRFAAGDALRLFYEIYDGRPPFRVTYRVEGLELDGTWVGLGPPLVAEQDARAQGWELPTSERWPDGDYRVQIEATDAEGRMVGTYVPFALGPAASAP